MQSAEVLRSKFTTLNQELRTKNKELSTEYKELINKTVVEVSPSYFRPTEVDLLIGNPAKAKEKLGWEAKTKLNELVRLMVKEDFQEVTLKWYTLNNV